MQPSKIIQKQRHKHLLAGSNKECSWTNLMCIQATINPSISAFRNKGLIFMNDFFLIEKAKVRWRSVKLEDRFICCCCLIFFKENHTDTNVCYGLLNDCKFKNVTFCSKLMEVLHKAQHVLIFFLKTYLDKLNQNERKIKDSSLEGKRREMLKELCTKDSIYPGDNLCLIICFLFWEYMRWLAI